MRLAWWQYGVFGGVVLSIATVVKMVRALFRGAEGEGHWTTAVGFAAFIFGMGFVCGLIVWAGRGLSRRFGMLGDAIVGMIVTLVLATTCTLVFGGPQALAEGGLLVLGLGAVVGLILGAWIGRDLRKEWEKEERKARRKRKARRERKQRQTHEDTMP